MEVRYSIRVRGIQTEFYKIASDDTTHFKLFLLVLEKRTHVAGGEEFEKALADMRSHSTTKMMMELTTIQATSATKRATWPEESADDG